MTKKVTLSPGRYNVFVKAIYFKDLGSDYRAFAEARVRAYYSRSSKMEFPEDIGKKSNTRRKESYGVTVANPVLD